MKREEIQQGLLPLGYRQLEYIRTTTSSDARYVPYINTGYLANNNSLIRIKYLRELHSSCVFGGRTSAGVNMCAFICDGDSYATDRLFPQFGNIGGTIDKPKNSTLNVDFELEISKNGAYINGDLLYNGFNSNTWSGTYPIYLFQHDNGGQTAWGHIGRIYYFRAYNNGVIARDMVPVLRIADSKPGMWDFCQSICPLTNSPFYVKAGGSGEFSWA